jgi:pimeloyl-ACP methyl ester carboxylesterase
MTAHSQFVALPSGRRLHLLRWGERRAGRPALVCVHGLGDNARVWEGLAEALGPRFEIVAPDLRGHGGSALGDAGECDIAKMASELHELVEVLALESPQLVGHSLGAQVAIRTVEAHPARYSRLALLDYAPELPPDSAGRLRAAIAAAQRVYADMGQYIAILRLRHPFASAQLLQSIARASLRPCAGGFEPVLDGGLLAHAVTALGQGNPQAWERLGRLRVPVEVVRGGCSSLLTRDMAARVARACGAAGVHEIGLAGHTLQVDAPARLARALWPEPAGAPAGPAEEPEIA